MALGTDYETQDCSLARSLELVGERWTMLILRDAFFGVRRFTDFQTRLDISKAVLTQRLSQLIDHGLLVREPRGGRTDYALTDAGISLWPALYSLMRWGDAQTNHGRPRRLFAHISCTADIDNTGRCASCATVPVVGELSVRPGPGFSPGRRTDVISTALRSEHQMLTPF